MMQTCWPDSPIPWNAGPAEILKITLINLISSWIVAECFYLLTMGPFASSLTLAFALGRDGDVFIVSQLLIP